MFPVSLISYFGDTAWVSRSPDQTAPNFFPRGYFKSEVYVNKPHTTMEFKEHISDKIKANDSTTVKNCGKFSM
jgi:hypothetical protein